MWLCKYNLSKECDGKYNDCVDCVLDEIKVEFKIKADGDDWYHTTDGLVWEEAIEIVNKHKKKSEDKE